MPVIDRRILAAALLLVSSAVTAHRANAQEAPSPSGGGGVAPTAAGTAAADSLPFRAGQWGADFAINDGAVGLGVLRFRSPRMAWVIDAFIAADWRESEYAISPDGSGRLDDDSNSLVGELRVGPRWYHPIATNVAAYVGTGITGGISRNIADLSDFESRGWYAGGFGDVGAAYFVTRRLSLGAQTGVYATYGRSTNRSGPPQNERKDQVTRLGVTSVRILGALYF